MIKNKQWDDQLRKVMDLGTRQLIYWTGDWTHEQD